MTVKLTGKLPVFDHNFATLLDKDGGVKFYLSFLALFLTI